MIRRVDAHHHVWDLSVRDQPWMSGDGMTPIRRSFGVDEFVEQAEANGMVASVVVQTVAEVAETEELLELAATSPFVAVVVGFVDVAAGDVGDQLDRLLERPSGSWLVGIRSLVQYEPDPHWLSRPEVLAGLAEVARRGLCNELLILPHQLQHVVDAVRTTEGRFVIDHLGKPAIASSAWEPWATEFATVARLDNVSAKVSGLVTEADWSAWTVDGVRPYVDHAISAFGPERIMFGSDWPVCTLAATYDRVVGLVEQCVAGFTADERAAIFGGNAVDVYALDSTPGVVGIR